MTSLSKFEFVALIAAFSVSPALCRDSNSELERQLRLARAEGLPTTLREFEAGLPKVKSNENAAAVYAKLPKSTKTSGDINKSIRKVLDDPTNPELVKETELELARLRPLLRVMDEAAKRLHCRFPKDYSAGTSIVFWPEFALIKAGASAKTLRAILFALHGKDSQAIAELNSLNTIANHLFEQPEFISHMVADTIASMRIRALADMLFRFPERTIYREALLNSVRAKNKLDAVAVTKNRLFDALRIIELSQTKSGRKMLMLEAVVPESDSAKAVKAKQDALARIVKAHRELAVELKGKQRKDVLTKIQAGIQEDMKAFPNAEPIYFLGHDVQDIFEFLDRPIYRKNWLTAFLRATKTYPFAQSIRTDDLINPNDGKPLRYQFDERVMKFEWDEREMTFTVPFAKYALTVSPK